MMTIQSRDDDEMITTQLQMNIYVSITNNEKEMRIEGTVYTCTYYKAW